VLFFTGCIVGFILGRITIIMAIEKTQSIADKIKNQLTPKTEEEHQEQIASFLSAGAFDNRASLRAQNITKTFQEATDEAVKEHQQEGRKVPVWKDGEIVFIEPNDIEKPK